jgi:hypothetical protein
MPVNVLGGRSTGSRIDFCIWMIRRLLLLLILVSIIGCERAPTSLPEEYLSSSTPVERAAPKRLLVDLYLDTSFSMRGFVANTGQTDQDLSKLVAALDGIARRNPRNVVHRWRFDPGPLSENGWLSISDSVGALESGSYTSRESAHPRLVDLFSPGAAATRFTIVITDLRLDGPSSTGLAQQLARVITQQDRGLGIFSIRLPFDGQIDRPSQPGNFSYRGPRRVYVLFFGYRPVVEQFAESLRMELQRQFIDADALVFAPRIVDQAFDIGDAGVDRLVGLVNLHSGLAKNSGKVLNLESLPDTVDGSVEMSLPLDRPVDGLGLTPSTIDIEPTVFIWRSNEWTEIHPDKTNLTYQKQIVRLESSDKIQQRLTFDLTVSAPAFFQQGWYYLDFRIRAKPGDLDLPPWISEADLPRDFLLENPTTEDSFRGRTPGLRQFLQALRQALPGDAQELGNLRILLRRQR